VQFRKIHGCFNMTEISCDSKCLWQIKGKCTKLAIKVQGKFIGLCQDHAIYKAA
jgi:hypothetical protein